MRKILFSLFLFLAAGGLAFAFNNAEATETAKFDWVLHDDLTDADVAHLKQALEAGYERVLTRLELESLPVITIQIWRDEENYQAAMEKALGSRAPGSRGYVIGPGEFRLLYHTLLSAQQEAVHEFVHVVTLNVNPDFGNNPRWLWEGVAQYLAGEFNKERAREHFKDGACPTLEVLNSPFDRGGTIYDTGYLLVDFIDKRWGFDHVVALIKSNADLEGTLGLTEVEFSQKWCAFVRTEYSLS